MANKIEFNDEIKLEFADLAIAVAMGTADDEQKLRFKELKAAAKAVGNAAKKVLTPETYIAKIRKQIDKLQLLIEKCEATGEIPAKGTRGRKPKNTDENAITE